MVDATDVRNISVMGPLNMRGELSRCGEGTYKVCSDMLCEGGMCLKDHLNQEIYIPCSSSWEVHFEDPRDLRVALPCDGDRTPLQAGKPRDKFYLPALRIRVLLKMKSMEAWVGTISHP